MSVNGNEYILRRSWQMDLARHGLHLLDILLPKTASRLAFRLFFTPRRPRRAKDAPIKGLSGTPVTIRDGQRSLAGYVYGDGPTVVLVHGWEASSERLSSLVQPLCKQGFRVVAFDGPAHGRSSGKRTDLLDFGQAIRSVIREYGPVHGIIAHSFGGAATMFLLAQDQDLQVNKVVLFGVPSEVTYMFDVFTAALGLSERVIQQMRHSFLKQFGQPIEAFSVPAVVGAVNLPALLIHDRQDRVVPFTAAQAIVQAWPTATLVATEGLGHRGTLRHPPVIETVLNFLTSKS